MSHSDSTFFKPFAFVLGALVLFTLFIMFIANALSPASPDDPLVMAQTKNAIAPVGKSRVAAPVEPAPAAEPAAEAADTAAQAESDDAAEVAEEVAEEASTESTETAAAETTTAPAAPAAVATAATAFAMSDVPVKVKAAVATNCAGCHNQGLDGAAKPDDAQAWGALSDKGIEALTASVINGKGKMPARAESTLSDEEIGQAVQLMVFNATGSGAQAASAAAAATAVATTSDTATEETTTEDASAEVASSEIPAEVMQVVDSTCSACHQAGVGNSPKLGDKDAWGARLAAKGIDGLTASSIAGIGVMPPRGGSSLDDEQMKLAVEYMLSK